MLSEFKKIKKVLTLKEKRQLIYLTFLKFISGLFDMIGIASIAPFLMVITNREILSSNNIILKLKNFFDFDNNEIIVFLAIGSLSLIVINQLIRVINLWYDNYVSHGIWHSITTKLFRYYLSKDYSFHIQTNSNSLLEKISIRANAAVAGLITPYFKILGNIFTLIFVIFLLILTDPFIALSLVFSIGIFYILVFLKLREKISTYGSFGPEFSRKTFKLVDQAFRSIKDIKVKNNEKYYIDLFNPLAKRYANNQINLHIFSEVPTNLIEIFAYIFGFSILIFLILFSEQQFHQVAVLMGLYAISLRRLLPAVQNIYRGLSEFKYYKPSFDIIYDNLLAAKDVLKNPLIIQTKKNDYIFNQKINFTNIKYNYPNTDNTVLSIEKLEIKAGSFVGITGKSGSGKSTFIDIMIGLLNLKSGKIVIDGKELNNQTINKWQSIIGYVPQSSFIADDTIKNNVALGMEEKEIDNNIITKVSDIANISNFINNELPEKYDTPLGENGVKLSGGQRQRIGIARALYNDPQILILDEATNALDGITENQIIKSILNIKKNKTIIMITHRMQSLMNCDEVLFFDNGLIDDKGSYEHLRKTNTKFKELEERIVEENLK